MGGAGSMVVWPLNQEPCRIGLEDLDAEHQKARWKSTAESTNGHSTNSDTDHSFGATHWPSTDTDNGRAQSISTDTTIQQTRVTRLNEVVCPELADRGRVAYV